MILRILILTFVSSIATANPVKKISVPVVFTEALAPKDTTSSERFQKEYEAAITTGKRLTADRLAKCGYEITENVSFYDASESVQALERGKSAEAQGAWLIIGPRRSNHYLLMVQGAPKTPSVSIMASAKEVSELGSTHLSLAASNAKMAAEAAKEAAKLMTTKSGYFSVVSEDCVTCVDFANEFDNAAKKLKLKKLGEQKIAGESPNLDSARAQITKLMPSVVLVPNYSKVSAYVINSISDVIPKAHYIGGDGWGDAKFGYVQNNQNLESARGITIRGFPPTEIGLTQFQLGKRLLENKEMAAQFPGSGTALAILKSFEGISEILCASKPKNKESFAKAFASRGGRQFSAPWGVSVYELKDGNITYRSTRR
jgi:hypothetical protein